MNRSPASLRLRGPVAALAAAAAAACYVLAVRPRLLHWGASTQETAGPLPGDELVRTPRMQSTRAVTINAPAASVWPWLVQLGAGRGGMYSYDLLENAAGLGMHSADRILPEYQRLDVGDVIPLVSRARRRGFRSGVWRPDRCWVLAAHGSAHREDQALPSLPPRGRGWNSAGHLCCNPSTSARTRLLSRTRYDYSPLPVGLILRPVLEPLQFIMERRMLLGIKSRAEGPVTGSRAAAAGS